MEVVTDGAGREDAAIRADCADQVWRRDVEGRVIAVNAVYGRADCPGFAAATIAADRLPIEDDIEAFIAELEAKKAAREREEAEGEGD